jgi:archaemetzincin
MQSILLVPFHPADSTELEALLQPLQSIFHAEVHLGREELDSSFARDAYRGQVNSSFLIASLLERFHGTNQKILGITAADLFVPVLTYVFGEAQLGGRAAVLSTHRLREEFYGLAHAPLLERSRIIKEAIHELGHTFGLVHCPSYACVMHSSTAVEEIDLKGDAFCNSCRSRLESSGDVLTDDR